MWKKQDGYVILIISFFKEVVIFLSDKFNKTYLGIELGSTRIKAVLLGEDFKPLASGSHTWENQFRNGYYATGEKVGQAWNAGVPLMKK